MKTKNFRKKLILNKETIVTLDSLKMAMPKGGAILTTACTPPYIETEGDVCSNACVSWDDLAYCNSWHPHYCPTFLC